MKKYIAPNAKFLNIESESLMALSAGMNEDGGDGNIMSNERERTPSNFIWGDED